LAAVRNALLILTFCYCAVSAVSHICALPAAHTYVRVYIRNPELEYTYIHGTYVSGHKQLMIRAPPN